MRGKYSRQLDTIGTETVGQVQKVTMAESYGYPALGRGKRSELKKEKKTHSNG